MPLRLVPCVAVATALTGAIAAAADLRAGEPASPRLAVDTAAPLFAGVVLAPGDGAAACLDVANTGSGRGRAALFAPAVDGPLARHLQLVVTRGQGGTRSCDGFRPDARTYGLDAPGVLYRGRLSDFPASAATAIIDPGEWPAGVARAYRFALELGDDPAAQGLAARWEWRLAAEGLETAPAPAPSQRSAPVSEERARSSAAGPVASACSTVVLAGAANGRASRTLVKTARVRGRVRSVLAVRVLGASGAERLVLTTGLRVRGRTLVIPRWARVGYRVNGAPAATASRRPFRVRVPAGTIRPGLNRVVVRVRPRRGRTQTTTFVLRATSTTMGGKRLCVLGS